MNKSGTESANKNTSNQGLEKMWRVYSKNYGWVAIFEIGYLVARRRVCFWSDWPPFSPQDLADFLSGFY